MLKKGLSREDYPAHWPPKEFFVAQQDVSRGQLEEFRQLVEKRAGETELDGFLRNNLPVLVASLSFANIGHHGAWVIPQQVVRPPLSGVQRGLKPEYIIGGRTSDGFTWYVLELKGADEQIFVESDGKAYFGQTANRGVFQLLEYIDYCSSAQAYLRDTLRLTNFREPRGLLLIGREDEMASSLLRERMKAAWNRATRGVLEVRTYDALLRMVQTEVFAKAPPKK